MVCTDVWSAGCVLAELLLGQPIFPGDSGVDQLVEIIKVLGTPTKDQIREMNPNYQEFKFPQIKAHPWTKVTESGLPEYPPNLHSVDCHSKSPLNQSSLRENIVLLSRVSWVSERSEMWDGRLSGKGVWGAPSYRDSGPGCHPENFSNIISDLMHSDQ